MILIHASCVSVLSLTVLQKMDLTSEGLKEMRGSEGETLNETPGIILPWIITLEIFDFSSSIMRELRERLSGGIHNSQAVCVCVCYLQGINRENAT